MFLCNHLIDNHMMDSNEYKSSLGNLNDYFCGGGGCGGGWGFPFSIFTSLPLLKLQAGPGWTASVI
jgi:hypothetical protein